MKDSGKIDNSQCNDRAPFFEIEPLNTFGISGLEEASFFVHDTCSAGFDESLQAGFKVHGVYENLTTSFEVCGTIAETSTATWIAETFEKISAKKTQHD